MCRLFGLVANKEVEIRFSMFEAINSFEKQSENNSDGWGIGWYEDGIPKVVKYGECARDSERFKGTVEEVWAKIVIAHVRRASSGSKSDENSHPFIYGNWIFAHNGTVTEDIIKSMLKSPYDENFTSEPIDSEVYFRFIMQSIEEEGDILEGIKKAVNVVEKEANDGGANFLLSNGKDLYGFRCGNTLHYLVRDPNEVFRAVSEETRQLIEAKALAKEKAVIIASERITESEPWKPLENSELIVVNSKLNVRVLNLF